MANTGISTKLLTHMQKRAGKLVTVDELVSEYGDEYSRTQIMSNMSNLKNSAAGAVIERVQTGVWKYHEPPVAAKTSTKMFELLRELPTGIMILIDDEGKLYRALVIE